MKILIAGMAAFLALAGLHAKAEDCNSACLESHMQHYLFHLEHHEAGDLPLADNLVAYENAKVTQPGDGIWQQVTGFPVPGHTFADASTGQVVFYGATDLEDGTVGSLFVRLKISNDEIVESELFTRGAYTNEGVATVGLLEPDILYTALVPEFRRSTRQELIKIVDLYMDGISEHDGSLFPASGRCDRYQAGNKFTNAYYAPMDEYIGTCQSSMAKLTGQTVGNRRFPVVIEELGIVTVLFIIPHAERDPKNATNVAEIFKIVDGKVRSIEEFSFGGVYPIFSGFPDE